VIACGIKERAHSEARSAAAIPLPVSDAALLRALLDSTVDGICLTDADGNILVTNAPLARMAAELGMPMEGTASERLLAIADKLADPERFRARMLEIKDSVREATTDEFQLAGAWRWYRGYTAPVHDRDDAFIGRIWILRDVSEGKRAEQTLNDAYEREREAARRLRELDRLKSDFVSTVSHELRTPLTSIRGFATTLVQRWRTFDDEQRRELVGHIETAGERLDRLIADLLDFTSLERGQLQINTCACDLTSLVHDTVSRLKPTLDGYSLAVKVTERLDVLADPVAVGRVLENLLTNAAKFSPPGPPITVEAYYLNDHDVLVRVADRGVGIPSGDLERVFERFYRSDRGHAHGTGIGLAIVKEFVEAQNGRVWAESTHEGTSFNFTLPRATA
jgi:PAS domain S-box-containing protein